jgi:hypothetical protein
MHLERTPHPYVSAVPIIGDGGSLIKALPGNRPILPYFAIVTPLGNLIERLAKPPEELRAENLREWVETVRGAVPIAEVRPRQRCKVAGVIQNIRIAPGEGGGSVEATIIDGSGQMTAKWLGRPSLAGIRLGVGLIMEGMPSAGQGGECMILNPEYELVPSPEHG